LSNSKKVKSTYYKNYVNNLNLQIKEEKFINTGKYIFKIKRTKRDFLICIEGHDEHGHFNTIQGCGLLMDYIITMTIPYNDYFREAIIRVIGEIEFNKFPQRNIQKYKNNYRR